MRQEGKVFIGTSGWTYPHWEGKFYPKKLKSRERLAYFAKYFNTVEINYSFYQLPSFQFYKNWHDQTPADFIFSLKVSRYITHIKKLKNVEKEWQLFLERAFYLKKKLGTFLLQFPSTFKFKKENLSLFERFFDFTEKFLNQTNKKIKIAIEVRNSSFENEYFFNLLKKHNTALVISNSPKWKEIRRTELADFCYIRMHGSQALFSSKYTKKQINNLAHFVKQLQQEGKNVYVYFNNDFEARAVENAKQLIELLASNSFKKSQD
jgi:uncharacterized protein YecE (DUF72 family)